MALLLLFVGFIILLKSRASIIGLAAASVVWYVCVCKNKRIRLYIFISLVLAAVLIFAIPQLRDLVIGNILLNNRGSLGLNDVSSGRLEQFQEIFLVEFPKAPFFGNGKMYIESLPLAALLSFGIFPTIPLLIFAAVPLYIAVKCRGQNVPINNIIFLKALSIAFLINGIFEERAPFGPGITYFFLWFTSGFVLCLERSHPVSIH